jgi:hypothetical protein
VEKSPNLDSRLRGNDKVLRTKKDIPFEMSFVIAI